MILDEAKTILLKAINKAGYKVDHLKVEYTDPQFGDVATNVAMKLANELKRPPFEIAIELKEALEVFDPALFEEVTVLKPGFINIKFKNNYLLEKSRNATTGLPQPYKNQVVVAEYSNPNPFKVLHAGHLYTTIIGDVIASLMQHAGAIVHRVNYGGDVGLHVAKAMWAIQRALGGELPDKLSTIPKERRLEWLSERYVDGSEAYEDNDKAKLEIIELNKKLYRIHEVNDRSSGLAKIYWTCREWSYKGFDRLYEKLQIDPFERYIAESEVAPLGIRLVKQGLKKGTFQESQGATVFKGEAFGLHTRVFINSQGLPTYEAKDLGLAAVKWQDYKFDLSIIITANEITEYMKVVVKAISAFYPEIALRAKHLTHGMVKLPGGKGMSSRRGNILRAIDVIDAAKAANMKINKQTTNETVLAAIKYSFLKQRMGGNIIYDPDESVAVTGNSGPYLQYAHARVSSILAKAADSTDSDQTMLDSNERLLVRKIVEYPEVFHKSVIELAPHHLANYLYELAQFFNKFYEDNRVIGDPREKIRLQIMSSYRNVLRHGLQLLNISAPDTI